MISRKKYRISVVNTTTDQRSTIDIYADDEESALDEIPSRYYVLNIELV